jgi:hypothetical protein
MTYQINQRVTTKKYGTGVIVDFEVCDVRFKKCLHFDQYEDGARIGIKLDTPENWPLHAHGLPYFVKNDLQGLDLKRSLHYR